MRSSISSGHGHVHQNDANCLTRADSGSIFVLSTFWISKIFRTKLRILASWILCASPHYIARSTVRQTLLYAQSCTWFRAGAHDPGGGRKPIDGTGILLNGESRDLLPLVQFYIFIWADTEILNHVCETGENLYLSHDVIREERPSMSRAWKRQAFKLVELHSFRSQHNPQLAGRLSTMINHEPLSP